MATTLQWVVLQNSMRVDFGHILICILPKISFYAFFCSLMCSVFLSSRIDDFHCPICLSCLSICRWDRLLGDFQCTVCPICPVCPVVFRETHYNGVTVEVLCWTVNVVCDRRQVPDSKISNKRIESEFRIRIESRSYVGPCFSVLDNKVLVTFFWGSSTSDPASPARRTAEKAADRSAVAKNVFTIVHDKDLTQRLKQSRCMRKD